MVSMPTNSCLALSHKGAALTPWKYERKKNSNVHSIKLISWRFDRTHHCIRGQRRLSSREDACRIQLILHWSVSDRNTCGIWKILRISATRLLLKLWTKEGERGREKKEVFKKSFIDHSRKYNNSCKIAKNQGSLEGVDYHQIDRR